MELRITNPQENWLTEQILWNNEELKAAIAEKVKDYKTIAYTEDSLKDMKADRADLNKLKKAFEDERKRVKKICMEPYTKFEQQVKEITALIDEPIGLIDSQIKEIDESRKAVKREEIEELFLTIGFQSFVKLDMIWDEKWLNATVTLPKIEEQMKSRMYQIGTDVVTISKLPEFKFEAMEVYRKTLDMNQAIQEGQRLADIQKRKLEAERMEAERKAREAEEAAKQQTAAEQKEEPAAEEETASGSVPEASAEETASIPEEEEPVFQLDFRVWGTMEQIMALREYMLKNQIRFGKVE
ncbi:DUF1351 domain-containing protein [Coprococcus sp. AF102-57]|uniref:DUF1351 domain-containing protein n=1 Tax=Coprococcus sp. AF102-57 TaxID=2997946 RepID=UPI0022E05ED0|nr:DUF1351 domain-containing protein [Coprococcus sp. AF102-57]